MCGRFIMKATPEAFESTLGLAPPPGYRPRYNIAPTQQVLAIVAEGEAPRPRMLRWGLVPFWADDPSIGNRLINARAETVADKPAFRAAFQKRRCLVAADGFYEWQPRPGGKRPMRIALGSGRPFVFAGLWERWGKGAHPIETCTILTTTANEAVRPIHERMPVLLDPAGRERWLDPRASRPELLELLAPWEGEPLEAYEVSTLVNSPANDLPECLDRVEEEPSLPEAV